MMKLAEVVQKLEALAPLRLAGSWDNVGLLVDPMTGADTNPLHIFQTRLFHILKIRFTLTFFSG